MGCGAKYAYLIRSADGREPDSRCFAYCSKVDAEDWRLGAQRFRDRVAEHHRKIGAVPPELARELVAYDTRVETLEEPVVWRVSAWARIVQASIESMEEGACLLEKLDDAATAAGKTPPELPGPAPKKKSVLEGKGLLNLDLDATAVIALVVIGYFAFRKAGD